MALDKDFEAINETDLNELRQNATPESLVLDYKLTLPGGSDDERKEFLADVSSFANTAGGHILYGIREQGGVPTDIPGIAGADPDAEITRLEQMLTAGLSPRLPGVRTRAVAVAGGNRIFIIRIPQSWAAPHAVWFKASSKFYARNSTGKYQLDVQGIRAAFLISENLAEKIRGFRSDRIAKIVGGQTPVTLVTAPKMIFHVVPVSAFRIGSAFDARFLEANFGRGTVSPTHTTGLDGFRHNIDGFLGYSTQRATGNQNAYFQIFRNGIIESVDARFLDPERRADNVIASLSFEESFLRAVPQYFDALRTTTIEPPYVLMLTLVGVKGYTMALLNNYDRSDPIDRDLLIVPDLLIDDLSTPTDISLKPLFDAVWNAAGIPESLHYRNGRWERR